MPIRLLPEPTEANAIAEAAAAFAKAAETLADTTARYEALSNAEDEAYKALLRESDVGAVNRIRNTHYHEVAGAARFAYQRQGLAALRFSRARRALTRALEGF